MTNIDRLCTGCWDGSLSDLWMCLLCPCLLRCGLLFDCTALVFGPVRDLYLVVVC